MDKNSWLIRFQERGRFQLVAFDDLTPAEQVFDAIWSLEGTVNNDGFDGYFRGSSGDTAFAVVQALQTIGAKKMARIVAKAIAVLWNSAPPREQHEREERLSASTPDEEARLEELSEEFFLYPDDLTELLYAYMQQHRGEFADAG